MRGRPQQAVHEAAPDWNEGFDPAPDDEFSAPSKPSGPTALCLACGAPPARGECPHDEVVTLDAPSASTLSAARLLERLTHERRAAERALRRQIEAEVLRGAANVELTLRPPPVAATELSSAPVRARRRRAAPESQGVLAFLRAGDGGESA